MSTHDSRLNGSVQWYTEGGWG